MSTSGPGDADIELFAERYRDLLAAMPDAIVVVNETGSIVLFNDEAERLFGMPAARVLGQSVEALVPSPLREAHQAHRGRYAAAPQRRSMGAHRALHGLHADGHRFPVEVSLSPLRIGTRSFTISAIRDVSERMRHQQALEAAQAAAERASAAKTQFLSRMSHELRTPLNAVLGFTQLMQLDDRHPLPAPQREQVHHVERAGRHLLAMINDLLDVSRIESGALSVSLEPLDVGEVAAEALAMTSTQAREFGVLLLPAAGDTTLHAHADRVRLRQVLINLLSNAVKYNHRGGRVELAIRAEGRDEVAVAVADTGIGMNEQQLAQLFQPFNRVGAERGPVEGTGIGLVIARRLAEMMGGRLEVASHSGVGSVFTLTLRAAAAVHAPARAERGEPVAAGTADAASLDVLYVEDNTINVEIIAAALRLRPAWRLRHAASGAEAIAQVQRARPDLLLVDMHLGDMTGLEMVASLERHPALAGITRVAISADALPRKVRQALDAGFERYLTKPLDVKALLRCLDDVAARVRPVA
ncbi:MAG: PAS domain S-box protein [Rubrivivax sp.]|nr:PAS domain S-box protein [Rubrivivax sp.]